MISLYRGKEYFISKTDKVGLNYVTKLKIVTMFVMN